MSDPKPEMPSNLVHLGHDFSARLTAVEANQRSHESLDAERHDRTMSRLDEVTERLRALEHKLWLVAMASFAAAAAGGSAGQELLKLLIGGG